VKHLQMSPTQLFANCAPYECLYDYCLSYSLILSEVDNIISICIHNMK